jgi:hypothetical protein
VLKATGDVATALWDRHFTLDQVHGRLATTTRISREQIVQSLGALANAGYVYADDQPHLPEIRLHLMSRGLEAYCHAFVPEYQRVSRQVLALVCQDVGADVVAIAHRASLPELLVEHILDIAEGNALVRLTRTGHYIVVREVSSHLRRWIAGAA